MADQSPLQPKFFQRQRGTAVHPDDLSREQRCRLGEWWQIQHCIRRRAEYYQLPVAAIERGEFARWLVETKRLNDDR